MLKGINCIEDLKGIRLKTNPIIGMNRKQVIRSFKRKFIRVEVTYRKDDWVVIREYYKDGRTVMAHEISYDLQHNYSIPECAEYVKRFILKINP